MPQCERLCKGMAAIYYGKMMRFSDESLLEWAKTWISEHWECNPASCKIEPLTHGGSARRYFRITHAGDASLSLIASAYNPEERKENDLFVSIAHFLQKEIGLATPQIYAHDPTRCGILMEDAGSNDLFSLRTSPPEIISDAYLKTIRALVPLYAEGLKKAEASRLQLMPGFDLSVYTWEQNYFLDHAVKQFAQIPLSDSSLVAVAQEMKAIADCLLAAPRTLVHRDLQSQNVLIRHGQPIFIDFQGMRVGTYFYDLASLIYDPYMSFDKNFRESFIKLCYEQLIPTPLRASSIESFTLCLKTAAAQRLMQALGAYGNLGLNLGKPHFLKYISPASRLLGEALSEIRAALKIGVTLENLSLELLRSAQAASCQARISCSDSTVDPTRAPRWLA